MSLGILCSGQGDQSPAMLDLLAGHAEAARVFDTFRAVTGVDAAVLSASEMHTNRVAQPLVCAFQLAVWTCLAPDLPEPAAFAGYSVGELAAHGCAGALPVDEVIAMARRRAELMDATDPEPAAMTAVRGLARHVVDRLAEESGAEVAIVNGEDRFVVGGPVPAIAAVETRAAQCGAKCTRLAVHVASHTRRMTRAAEAFRSVLDGVSWRRGGSVVLAGLDGRPIFDPASARRALAGQIAATIDWAACLEGLRERGCTVLLELGPGSGLARMARDLGPAAEVRSVAEFRSLEAVAGWVAARI